MSSFDWEAATHAAYDERDALLAECSRLRRERDDARNQVEDVIGVEASSWMLRAEALKAELEKVEAERDHMAGELPIIEQAMVGYRDEAEALRVECDLWKEQADGVNKDLLDALAERDRYRAALERIADTCYCDEPVCKSMQLHARRALNGGTDD